MKRFLASLSAVSLVAGLSGHTSGAAPAAPKKKPAPTPGLTQAQRHAADLKKSAPADEYFGKLKMSYLGINNTLRDQGIRSGDYTTNDSIIHAVSLAEDALRDWRQKYPNDPQLPRTLFLMGKMYTKIWTNYGQGQAAYYLLELQNHYAGNYFGKLVKQQLAKGFTEHILAEALPCPTPVPTDAPTQKPVAGRNRATPTPVPSPTDTPTAVPTPQPLATPTVPPNSNIHIQVISVPCYTPVPSPSPTPTPSPIPSGVLVPTPSPTVAPSGTPASGAPPSRVPAPSGTPSPSPAVTGTPAGISTPAPRPSPTHKR